MSDLWTKMRVEDTCSRPLEETQWIDDGENSPVTFADCKSNSAHGAGGSRFDCTCILEPETTTPQAQKAINTDFTTLNNMTYEHDLFTRWGLITKDQLVAWMKQLRRLHVLSKMIIMITILMLANFFEVLLATLFVTRLIVILILIALPPPFFALNMINKLQTVSAMSAYELVDELKGKKLSAATGCNVKDLKAQLADLCKKLKDSAPNLSPWIFLISHVYVLM
jgi:hypothetical protein